jgi:hypothetical protein
MMRPMRRLARHLFTLCAVGSLLLCLGLCVLWIRSYWRADISWKISPRAWSAASNRGELTLAVLRTNYEDFESDRLYDTRAAYVRPRAGRDDRRDPAIIVDFDFAGFVLFVARSDHLRDGRWHATLPHWFAAAPLALPPLLWLRGYRRRRRAQRSGLCHACGYDLRASPDRCPERGAAAV